MFDSGRVRGWGVPVLLVTAVLGLSACGDDDEDESTAASGETTTEEASAEEVTVVATEYEFDLSATPTAETKSVVFQNDGEEAHVMILAKINEGFTTEEAIEMEGEKGSADVVAQTEAGPGKTETAQVRGTIEPGDYAMLCPIGGPEGAHYELGQLEEFPIE